MLTRSAGQSHQHVETEFIPFAAHKIRTLSLTGVAQKGNILKAMIEEDLIAERIPIESYREMVAYLGDEDSTARRMLEEILASEEEHADDLSSLLVGMKD